MRKYILLLAIFISFFYLFQNVNALDYKCDSRPNGFFNFCGECPPKTCSTELRTSPCISSSCPSGTVLVDCPLRADNLYQRSCINLECGDAGVASGNTCIQGSLFDSSCVNTVSKTYGWTDTASGWPSCTCSETQSTTVNQYNKKADGADCTKDGKSGKCDTSGRCITPPTTCTSPSQYQNSNNCQSGGCYWCAPPAYSGYCEASSDKCTSPCTYTGNPTKDDAACADTCETGGCNLRINICTTGGTCGYSGTSKFCGIGNSCDKAVECYQSTGACGASGSGGSSWLYKGPISDTPICSSGCPTSYPNQQWVACEPIPGCNPGTSGCASYDPIQGETPCCTAGEYNTCGKQEVCKPTGCKNICTDPATDKNAEPYCSKCNSCQDGVQNCGEPSVDKCGPNCGQPCTVQRALRSPFPLAINFVRVRISSLMFVSVFIADFAVI